MENEEQMFEFKEIWVRSTANNDNNDYQLRSPCSAANAVLEFLWKEKVFWKISKFSFQSDLSIKLYNLGEFGSSSQPASRQRPSFSIGVFH